MQFEDVKISQEVLRLAVGEAIVIYTPRAAYDVHVTCNGLLWTAKRDLPLSEFSKVHGDLLK